MLVSVTGDDSTRKALVTRAGKPAELETLYVAYAGDLTRALHAAGYPDAADVVQEAFVQAVVQWRRVSRYDDPVAWIRRVAINRGRNRRRSRVRRDALTQRIASTTSSAPMPAVEHDGELVALVAALPPQQRLALSLFYFADLSVAECADAMELSQGAVKYHLHAARTSLGRALDVRDDA
jgi:RNA polymerase sigma-70 factor (ECF subfamily)